MILAQLTAAATVQAAGIGGAIGAACAVGFYALRDRATLMARWRHWRAEARGELVAPFEPLEPEGYVEAPVTAEERRFLPLSIIWFALLGASGGVWIETGSQWPFIAVTLLIPLYELIRPQPQDSSGAEDESAPPKPLVKRLPAVVGAMLLAAVPALALVQPDWLKGFGFAISSDRVMDLIWSAIFISALGAWLWRTYRGPPDLLEGLALEEWKRDTNIALLAAIALAVIATIVWLA